MKGVLDRVESREIVSSCAAKTVGQVRRVPVEFGARGVDVRVRHCKHGRRKNQLVRIRDDQGEAMQWATLINAGRGREEAAKYCGGPLARRVLGGEFRLVDIYPHPVSPPSHECRPVDFAFDEVIPAFSFLPSSIFGSIPADEFQPR